MKNNITVRCRIDEKTFRDFAMFDTFRLRKRWRLPAGFLALMLVFAVVCFVSGKREGWLPGTILAVIGIGMPAVYIGSFLSQVKKKAAALKLKKPRAMYTLSLTDTDGTIHNDFKAEENVTLPWEKLWGAARVKGAIYLYATPQKAFILPDGQADAEDAAVYDYLKKHLPAGKMKG